MDLLARAWEALTGLVSPNAVLLLFLRLTAIAAVGHLLLAAMHRRSAAARNLVAVATLATMLAAPALGLLGTFTPPLRVPMPKGFATEQLGALPAPAVDAASDTWSSRHATARTSRRPAVLPPTPRDVGAGEITRVEATTPAPAIDASDASEPASWSRPVRFAPRASDWPAALALLGLAGALVLLASRLVALLATLWVARRGRPAESPRLRQAFERAAARLDVRETVELLVTDHLDVPAVIAFPRPRLLLPAAALEWDEARLDPVFVHELAHVVRRDGFGFAVGRFATALLWFHPLVWTLAYAARQDCERACDDVVLGAGVRASDYADQLLAIAQGANSSERWSSMSLAFARPSSLEGRLLSILRADARRSPVTRRSAWALAATLVVLLLPLATVRVVAEPHSKHSDCGRTSSTSTCTRTATVTRTVVSTSESVSSCPDQGQLACNKTDEAGNDVEANDPDASGKSGDEWYEQAKNHYDAKEFADAGDAYEHAASSGYETGKAWYNAACSWSLAGKRNRAVGDLHAAIDNGFADPRLMASDDDLNAVHEDRRFQMLLNAAQHGTLSKEDGSEWKNTEWKNTEWKNTEWKKTEHKDKEWKNDKEDKDGRDGDRLQGDDDSDDDDASGGALRSAGMWELRHGDRMKAARLFQKEYAADSTASALYNVACAYALAGDKDRALAALEISLYAGYGDGDKLRDDDDLRPLRHEPRFEKLVTLADDLSPGYPSVAGFLTSSERRAWERTLPRLERVTREHPNAGRAWFNLGLGELRSEHAEESHDAWLRALSLGYRRSTTLYNLACAAAQMGDKDEAFRRLDQAVDAGMDIGSIAPGDDDLEPLHHDPRFERLMDRADSDRDREKHGKSKWKS